MQEINIAQLLILASNIQQIAAINELFSLPNNLRDINCGCDPLHYHLDNIFIRFDSKLYRQILYVLCENANYSFWRKKKTFLSITLLAVRMAECLVANNILYSIELLYCIPMCTICAPLVADMFCFYYERDFILSHSDNNQADFIEAFNYLKISR